MDRSPIVDHAPDGGPSKHHAALRNDLFGFGVVRRYPKGATLIEPGSAPQLLAIRRGAVLCGRISATGQETIYHLGRPGFWFGMALVLQEEFPESHVGAHTDVVAMAIAGKAVASLVAAHPEYHACLARLPLARLRSLLTLLERGGGATAESRVASRLHHLRRFDVEGDNSLANGSLQISQALLARITRLSRATVKRVLLDMARAGVVRVGFRSITILDPARLARLADLDESRAI